MENRTNHGSKIPLDVAGKDMLIQEGIDASGGDIHIWLEDERPMRCSYCGERLSSCECPASLARSIDKERADAIRERNEARRERDSAIASWSRTEGERLKLEQEVRDLRTALDATRAVSRVPPR